MTPDQNQTSSPSEESAETSLPSTHFQTVVTLEDQTSVGIVILEKPDGDIQFYLDRQLGPAQFGPAQIVEALVRLNSLNNTLNKYVNDRIQEAKETAKKETQPELSLDTQPDSLPTESVACEAETCCGGLGFDEVAAHAGQPE